MPFDRLFIRARGETFGPFTLEQIGLAILERRLTPSHEVSPDGESWFAAGTIWSEIRPILPPPPDIDDSHSGRRRRRRRRSGEDSGSEEGDSRSQSSVPPPRPVGDDLGHRENAPDEAARLSRPSEPSGTPQPAPPSAGAPPPPPPARPPIPPLPPRPSTGSSPAGPASADPASTDPVPTVPAPSGPAPSGSPSSGPPIPPETVTVPKVEANLTETVSELDLSGPAEEGDPSTSRRRRRSSGSRRSGSSRSGSERSGSRRPGHDTDEIAGGGGQASAAGLPAIWGVLARVAPAVLVLLLVAHLVAAIYLLMTLFQFDDYLGELQDSVTRPTAVEVEAAGQAFAEVIAERFEYRRVVIAVELGFLVLSATLLLIWKFHVNACLRRTDVIGLRYTPGGCIGWYFVPIAQLFKPYQAMRELWIAADPYPYDHRRDDAAGWVTAWWSIGILAALAAIITSLVVTYLRRDLDKVGTLYQELKYEPVLIACGLVPAVVQILLITKLSRRLSEKVAADAAYEAEG